MFPLVLTPPDASLAERLGGLVMAVIRVVGERTLRVPSQWLPAGRLISVPMAMRVQEWLQTRRRRIVALLARIEAGRLRPPRPYVARPVAEDAAGAPRPKPAEPRLPRGFAWLCGMAQEARGYGCWIGLLLNEAEMKAAALAAPQMVRLWIPLLNALGETKPDWLPGLPKRPRRPRPRKVRALSPLAAWREHAKWCAQSGRGGGKRFWRNPKGTMFDPRLPMPPDPLPPPPPAPPPLPEVGVVVRRGPAPFWETQVGMPYRSMFARPFGGTFQPGAPPGEAPAARPDEAADDKADGSAANSRQDK